jgi:hypothetical protein
LGPVAGRSGNIATDVPIDLFAQPIIKTVNLLSIIHSILYGFLTGSKTLPQKNAYKSCATCISCKQKTVGGTDPAALLSDLYIADEKLHYNKQMQQCAVNNRLQTPVI